MILCNSLHYYQRAISCSDGSVGQDRTECKNFSREEEKCKTKEGRPAVHKIHGYRGTLTTLIIASPCQGSAQLERIYHKSASKEPIQYLF